jgi:uncharacterized protein (UPF0333 family)
MQEAGSKNSPPEKAGNSMEVISQGILGDNSGQGSIEYLLISIGALVIAGIFFFAIRDSIQAHTKSISNHYN